MPGLPIDNNIKTIAFLQLGTNLGDRHQNLLDAHQFLIDEVGEITSFSPIYETAAWGVTDQPDFLNQIIKLSTTLNPFELLDKVLDIEKRMGRERKRKWGERLIDIDILFYGNRIIETERLVIPHNQIQNRNFVLYPLNDIASSLVHPVLNKTIAELKQRCQDQLSYKIYNEKA